MQTSLDKFDEFLQNNDTVVPDLRTTLYAVNIRYSKKAYVKVKEIYNTTQLNEEKLRCLRSLGAVHDDNYLKKTLESSINGEVRSQDAMLVIMGVADNPRGALMAWEFFKDNYETFKQKYDGSVLFGRMIKSATQGLVYKSEEQDVKQFFESRETPATKRSIAQALETIKLNARWLERSKGEIEEWLRNNS
jgi:aminopeptidase N